VSSTDYDALVIGCSPGGGSTATYLARAGKRVLVPRITFAPLHAQKPESRQHPAKV
jgi:2-polyprenyl-6-methoxyphenol hydroxylase-like FAD-dependent oxidoreductase